jgi:hypothetical protein
MQQQRRRDPEGDEVCERIELAPERTAAAAPPGEVAVDRIQHRRDGDGGEGRAEATVGDEHERHDTRREARARHDVRDGDERPHVAAPAVA